MQRLNYTRLVVNISQAFDADDLLVLRNLKKANILFGRIDQILIQNHVGRFFPLHSARARKANIAGDTKLFFLRCNKRTASVRANQKAAVHQL